MTYLAVISPICPPKANALFKKYSAYNGFGGIWKPDELSVLTSKRFGNIAWGFQPQDERIE